MSFWQVIATQCPKVCKLGFLFIFGNSSIVACRGGSVAGVLTAIHAWVESSGRFNFPSSPNIFLPTVPAPLTHLLRPGFRVSNTLSTSLSIHFKQLKISLIYTKNQSKQETMEAALVVVNDRQVTWVFMCLFIGYKPAMTREDLKVVHPVYYAIQGIK